MAQQKITVEHKGNDITIRGGSQLLGECINELLQCAETNDCLSDGLRFTAKCIETIAKHNERLKCASKGFGLAAK